MWDVVLAKIGNIVFVTRLEWLPMFGMPGRLTPTALQRPGAIFNYVNDICTEICGVMQTNVTKVCEGLNSPVHQRHPSTDSYEQKVKGKSKYTRLN